MRVPGTGKARPAPAVTERAWAEMPTGRRRWATAPLSGTSSGQTGPPRFPATTPRGRRIPPNTDPSAVSRPPGRFRRAHRVSALEPLGGLG
jgi:hypothetical protein